MSSFEPLHGFTAGPENLAFLPLGADSCAPGFAAGFGAPGNTARGTTGQGDLAELQRLIENERAAAREEALAEARMEIAAAGEALAAAVSSLEEARAALLAEAEQELLDLAFEVAGRIVQRELAEHPQDWLELVAAGVRRVRERTQVRLRLGSRLHRWVVGHVGELRARLAEVRVLDVIEDPTLTPEGCIAETPTGTADLTIAAQLETLRDAVAAEGEG